LLFQKLTVSVIMLRPQAFLPFLPTCNPQCFLSMLKFYCRFFPGSASVLLPFTDACKGTGQLSWTPSMQSAFQAAKMSLAVPLQHPEHLAVLSFATGLRNWKIWRRFRFQLLFRVIYIHIHLRIRIHICVHIRKRIQNCACMYMYIYIYEYVYVNVYVFITVYVYIYSNTYFYSTYSIQTHIDIHKCTYTFSIPTPIPIHAYTYTLLIRIRMCTYS
jgi:hypothetical protein